MSVEWNEALGLPDATLAGDRRIDKTMLVRGAGLTRHQEKMLRVVERLSHYATIQKSTTRIPPVSDDSHEIGAVIYLRCRLRVEMVTRKLDQLLHGAFPNPTVVLYDLSDGRRLVSVTVKRKSLAEAGAVTVEEGAFSGAFDVRDGRYAGFMTAISFESLPQADLLSYARALCDRVSLAAAVGSLGFYPVSPAGREAEILMLAEQIVGIGADIEDLDAVRRAPETTLAESSRMRVELRNLKRKREGLVGRVMEVCDGQ